MVGELIMSPDLINNVSVKYGFKQVGYGCAVTLPEINGIEIYNAQIDKYLDKLNGENWRENYRRDLDSLWGIKPPYLTECLD